MPSAYCTCTQQLPHPGRGGASWMLFYLDKKCVRATHHIPLYRTRARLLCTQNMTRKMTSIVGSGEHSSSAIKGVIYMMECKTNEENSTLLYEQPTRVSTRRAQRIKQPNRPEKTRTKSVSRDTGVSYIHACTVLYCSVVSCSVV